MLPRKAEKAIRRGRFITHAGRRDPRQNIGLVLTCDLLKQIDRLLEPYGYEDREELIREATARHVELLERRLKRK